MGFKSIKLVESLARCIPNDAHTSNLMEEHAKLDGDRKSYETKSYHYVLELLAQPSTSLIVLTGDAGHGKTHLCKRILEAGGKSGEEALQALKDDPEGQTPIALDVFAKPLRIVKDLSDDPDEVRNAVRLLELIEDETSIGLVCANEGRLRSAVYQDMEKLGPILDSLSDGLHRGTTTKDGVTHVVNLNYQAIAPKIGGFLEHILDQWAKDNRRWPACTECDAAESCPISKNRHNLSSNDSSEETSREGLLQLVRAAEQTGYVLTIREALILVAYLITGELQCEDVWEAVEKKKVSELTTYQLENLLFNKVIRSDLKKHLGILDRIRRFDPGIVPFRDIDEAAIQDLESEGDLGNSAWLGDEPLAQTKRQLRDEASKLQELVRKKRRELYFSAPSVGAQGVMERTRRLGLYHYSKFDHIQGDDEDPGKMRKIVEKVVEGLHVIQGIRPRDKSHLVLVDPAFARSGSHTSVIAYRISKNSLWLWGLHEYWKQLLEGHTPSLMTAVDWLDRQVVLCEQREGELPRPIVTLNMLQFEFVLRASEGVVFPEFHSADRRRILRRLAKLAEDAGQEESEIRFVAGDTIQRIVVERDRSIEVHGGD